MKWLSCLVLAISPNLLAQEMVDDVVVLDEEEVQPQVLYETAPGDESEWDALLDYVRSGAWTCWARNRRGQTFSGRSSSRSQARRLAMRRCGSSGSSSCSLRNCR